MDFHESYHENTELYDQAFRAHDREDALKEFREGDYRSPFDLLEPEERKKIAEVAEAQSILNGETGSLAGMDYLHTGRASDRLNLSPVPDIPRIHIN